MLNSRRAYVSLAAALLVASSFYPASIAHAQNNGITLTKAESVNDGEATGEGAITKAANWEVFKDGSTWQVWMVVSQGEKVIKTVWADYDQANGKC